MAFCQLKASSHTANSSGVLCDFFGLNGPYPQKLAS
uniref:Uncharacterized protein n=1 Tax=Anguilla anguilla TaxID=7936 RepID=A0A0E9T8I1_ANGAN